MAPLNPPAWQQAGTYPARLDRLTMAGLLAPHNSAGPLVARSGVKPSPSNSGMQVLQRATPDKFVTVGAGTCFVAATSAIGGSYECVNDAAYDVQIADAHATLNRRDLVVARVYDALDDVGSTNLWAIEPVQGTPAASPARPATPNACVVLAEVLVPGGSSSVVNANVTDMRTYVTALGGVLPVGASDVPASPYSGMPIYRRDLSRAQLYDGSSWRDVFDSGMTFAFGTLATVFGSTSQDITTTNEAATSAKVGSISGLQFTIPPGVPSNRRMYASLSINIARAGSSAYYAFWMDGASLAAGRRIGIPAGPESHDFSVMRSFPLPAAGTHTLDLRVSNESTGQTTTFFSGTSAVLLL